MQKLLVALAALCALTLCALAMPLQAADVWGARLLRVHVTSPSDVVRLAQLGADICARGHDFVEVMVPSETDLQHQQPELARFLGGLRREVINDNPGAMAQQLAQDPNLGVYHTLAEVKTELEATVAAHPDLCSLSTIGKSIEGRDIWCLRIGSDPQDGKHPLFLFTGLHHAREWISTEVPMGLIKKLTGEYATSADVKALVDGRTIYVVPVVNPDGLNHSQTQYQMWRKNRRKNADGSWGVDVNRNYSYKWGGVGSSDSPDSDTYHGASASSEPETTAIIGFARAHHPVAAISFHSYSELVLWPWGYTSEATADAAAFAKHGQAMAQINGYTPEQSIELYPTTGDFDDFMYGDLSVLSYTIELGKEFIPEESEVAGIVEKNVRCCLYLLKEASDPFPLLAHTPLTTQTSAQGPYAVQARLRLATHTGFQPKSVQLFWKRATDAGFAHAPMIADLGDASIYRGSIPGAGYGTVSYYITATGADGSSVRYPESGTCDFKVVEKLALVVADDGGKGLDSYYTKALDAAGVDYAVWKTKTAGPVPHDTLMQATAVVWFTGSEYASTLTPDDQALLGEYLDKGGRLLLFGQDIGYDIKDSAFYKQRLCAKFIKDASGIDQVSGATQLAGFAGSIGGSPDSIKQNYADVFEVLPATAPAQSATRMTYGASGPAAALTVQSGASRLAYFGFGLEGISGEANRTNLMKTLLAWLSGSVEVALVRSAAAALTGADGRGPVASEAMDDELAARLAAEVATGQLDGVKRLVASLVSDAGPARRVARLVMRRLPVEATGAARTARSLLANGLGAR